MKNSLMFLGSLLTSVVFVTASCISGPVSTVPCQKPAAQQNSTSPTYNVRVAVDVCVEDRQAILGAGEYSTLDCNGDGGTYRVLFPRKAWLDMKRDGTGLVNAGPGK